MFGVTEPFPVYLMRSMSGLGSVSGFGQETPTTSDIQSWISDVMKPIADVVKEYYDLQAAQQGVQAQKVVQTASLAGISPIYLVVGGLAIWYLSRGGMKGQRRRKGR